MKALLIVLLIGFSYANRIYNYQRAQDIIDKQNAKEGSWTAGHTDFSYMSLDEKKQYAGLDLSVKTPDNPRPGMKLLGEVIGAPPLTWDWRSHVTCIGAVRNQYKCGSNWAFSCTSTLADRFCMQQSVVQELSVQQMVDCDTLDSGCEGGNLQYAWEYLDNTGVVSEACYPYTSIGGIEGACKNFCPAGGNFGLYKSTLPYTEKTVDEMKLEIYMFGPIQTGFELYEDLLFYSGGVYIPDTSSYRLGGHAVEVIGWGIWGMDQEQNSEKPSEITDSFPIDQQYWIVKNSWGNTFGYSGYFYFGMDSGPAHEVDFEKNGIAGDATTHP